ncbi:ABC transporter ATP-binding protein [Ectothiorhodospiraceae bacterium WFHF3C12]|nr:ABC transporter ATP-binding protein [Ectothiorhodospiraceae bacterium WFHF3C12]
MALLEIDKLEKSFGGVHAIQDLSFAVSPGSVHSVIGPNGAGKTTLFNLITGLYTPTSGRILLDGRDVGGMPSHRLAAMGMSRTFQNLQVCMNMSAVENVMMGRHLHLNGRILPSLFRLPAVVRGDRACRERSLELMEFVGIQRYADAHASAMPYGALKRLEIARALAAEPRLLLLDEPAAGLNANETAEIDELIKKVADSGVTVVLVEHDMKLVMNISDHILVLDYGKKLAEGDAATVRHNPDVISAYLGAA